MSFSASARASGTLQSDWVELKFDTLTDDEFMALDLQSDWVELKSAERGQRESRRSPSIGLGGIETARRSAKDAKAGRADNPSIGLGGIETSEGQLRALGLVMPSIGLGGIETRRARWR